MEDDNGFSFDEGSMYLEWDGPAALTTGGSTVPGSHDNALIEIVADWSDGELASFTSENPRNAGSCTLDVTRADEAHYLATFECRGLVGKVERYPSGARVEGVHPVIHVVGSIDVRT